MEQYKLKVQLANRIPDNVVEVDVRAIETAFFHRGNNVLVPAFPIGLSHPKFSFKLYSILKTLLRISILLMPFGMPSTLIPYYSYRLHEYIPQIGNVYDQQTNTSFKKTKESLILNALISTFFSGILFIQASELKIVYTVVHYFLVLGFNYRCKLLLYVAENMKRSINNQEIEHCHWVELIV